MAALSCDISYYPMDTLKVRIQAKNTSSEKLNIKSLYKGSSIVLLMSVPSGCFYFIGYDLFKYIIIANNVTNNDHIINMFGGIGAELFNTMIRTPFETVKQNMQNSVGKNPLDAFRIIYNDGGIKELYRGFLPMLSREVPYSILLLPIYEVIKKYYKAKNIKENRQVIDLDFYQSSVVGVVSGFLASFLTVPNDVVKTKIMTDRGHHYNGIKNTIKLIYKEDGFSGFFRGWKIRSFMIALTNVPYFIAYEQTKQFMKSVIL